MFNKASTTIKNIIFDLGGVLFAVDYHLTAAAFDKIGFNNFATAYSQAQQSHVFDAFEKGNVTAAGFRNFIRENGGRHLTDEQIDHALCSMLIGMPAYKFDTLKKLSSRFRLFLLSNTNEIHLPEVRNMIQQQTPGKRLEDYFEKCYYSHIIKMRKPDAEAFRFVLNENKLLPAETLFIDDSPQHLTGAAACGIHTSLITTENNTEVLFADYLL